MLYDQARRVRQLSFRQGAAVENADGQGESSIRRKQQAENIWDVRLHFWKKNEDGEPGIFSVGKRSNIRRIPPLRALHSASLFTVEGTIVNTCYV
jgi:hypothetical protein